MSVLGSELRRDLEAACLRGRRASVGACRAALGSLGVSADRPPGHLGDRERALRRGLRAKSRQLGDWDGSIELLLAECAFEQWHRLLFARFLAENELLIHPDLGVPVSLVECDELAPELGERDGWGVAARFAAAILPGIFRLEDPCVQLRLAPEGRLELEGIVASLPAEVFAADDALGWVYQFWQSDRKDEVNEAGAKIGGADLGPVTQLFTESYMVRFLLQNSLGAWWAARHPDSGMVKNWDYLRFDNDDDGSPAAGGFEQWPDRVGEVTVMDPCCGSGHFVVEAFSMLWPMRVEEEGLSPRAAQDAVLRDNLFGLELDPRCVQIAMFALALQAWKAGAGWRELPVPNIACSGIPVKATAAEWRQLAKSDYRLETALVRLHALFRDAETLGSLIDPRRAVEKTGPTDSELFPDDVAWDEVTLLLEQALSGETDDPATAVLGTAAAGICRAADYLSRSYTLVATNVPFLGRGKQRDDLKQHLSSCWPWAKGDLALAMRSRWNPCADSAALVLPQNWLEGVSYRSLRNETLKSRQLAVIAWLGSGAFRSITGEVVQPVLWVDGRSGGRRRDTRTLDLRQSKGVDAKAVALRTAAIGRVPQAAPRGNPDQVILPVELAAGALLANEAHAWKGICSSDYKRFGRFFWEMPELLSGWRYQQSTVASSIDYGGRESVLFWEDGFGQLTEVGTSGAPFVGKAAWGRSGVAVSQMGKLAATIYTGECFDNNVAVLTLQDPELLVPLWAFVQSGEHAALVRKIAQQLKVTNATLTKVPFDVERWRRLARQRFPDGLPEPYSADPTQWLFDGSPKDTTAPPPPLLEPLQVAVARLLGYRWPGQASDADNLDGLADDDGIVCLPSVCGERAGADRLRQILASAASAGSAAAGSNDLESWLRNDFFEAHCKLFKNRPFIWHIWDGRKDGFAALVNYHRLDRATLEKLAFTYLGDWIERQTASVRDDEAGAADRLAAAQDLRRRLRLILDGESPYDVFVRWKSLAEQPLGWNPDLNDGVRLNVRPFVQADVLRSKFGVSWDKDRGKNPDGSERHNDLHHSLAEKETARQGIRR